MALVLGRLQAEELAEALIQPFDEELQGMVAQLGDSMRRRLASPGGLSEKDSVHVDGVESNMLQRLRGCMRTKIDRYRIFLKDYLFVQRTTCGSEFAPANGGAVDPLDWRVGDSTCGATAAPSKPSAPSARGSAVEAEAISVDISRHIELLKQSFIESRRLLTEAKQLEHQLVLAQQCKQSLIDADNQLRAKRGFEGGAAARSDESVRMMECELARVLTYVEQIEAPAENRLV